jgi:hypothetical protein
LILGRVRARKVSFKGELLTRATVRQSTVSTLIVLLLIMPGCCGSYDSGTKAKDEDARLWLHNWTGPYNWTAMTDWRRVSDSRMQQAETLLQVKDSKEITAEQAHDLTGMASAPGERPAAPYLLRGVGAAVGNWPQEVYTRTGGDVWVGGGANSRCPVAMRRRPVVVWMSSPPREVYVTFIVAQ